MPGDAASGGAGPLVPVTAVQAPHQGVVGVAALRGEARESRLRRDGVLYESVALHDLVTVREDAQRQGCVLAKGARKSLVEAAHLLQDAAPVGEVGGDPSSACQSGRTPLPVGGGPPWGQRTAAPPGRRGGGSGP